MRFGHRFTGKIERYEDGKLVMSFTVQSVVNSAAQAKTAFHPFN